MAPGKLTDSDKQQITQLYCQPGETTSTLASRFGVSSSTVGRVLKQMLSDEDYAHLMQWKRTGERGEPGINLGAIGDDRSEPTVEDADQPSPVADDRPTAAIAPSPEETEAIAEASSRRSRRRSQATSSPQDEAVEDLDVPPSAFEEPDEAAIAAPSPPPETERDFKKPIKRADRLTAEAALADSGVDDTTPETADTDVAAWVSEGLAVENDYDDDDDDDDWDADDDEEDDWDDEADEAEIKLSPTPRQEALSILSFADFETKKPCYLVVDRLAELITCPLKEFAELGLIPAEEEQAKTLPVFDNHRVARRFARRNQRVIKVPNGLMLNKTQPYLQAKGITRLLFEGQVYALT